MTCDGPDLKNCTKCRYHDPILDKNTLCRNSDGTAKKTDEKIEEEKAEEKIEEEKPDEKIKEEKNLSTE